MLPEAEGADVDWLAGFGPALAEWVEFVHDYSDDPQSCAVMFAACVSLIRDPSGFVDFKLADRKRMEAAAGSRKALSISLRDLIAHGFLCREEGKPPRHYVRPDVVREVLDARAGIRREGLRVLPGGKRDAPQGL